MPGVSVADPGTASNTAHALDAAIASGGFVAPRQWSFASDARAALMVCLRFADILVVAGTGIISYLIRYGLFSIQAPYLANIVIGCVIFSLILQSAGMYRFPALRHRGQHLKRLSGCWAATILLLISIIYGSKLADEFSRGWIVLWAVSGWLGLMGTRRLTWRVMRSLRARGHLLTHTAVVGYGSAAAHLAERLQSNNNDDVRVIGVFEPANVPDDPPGSHAGRDLGCLLQLTASMMLDEIVVAMPCTQLVESGSLFCELSAFAVDVKVYLDFAGAGRAGGPISILVPIWERPLAGLPSVIKRGMDICLSAMMLIITLPLMVLIAVLVKLDSLGPVLFRQQRFGFSKKPFTLYKFRTMRWEAADDPSVPQARRNDPRVTRVGRFLRRTSLDELPQFFNVLKGDMSLVGPRPHPTPLDDKFAAVIDRYLARHHVKPGITGWAQVNGFRGETDTLDKMERRVEHDLHYIDHWSTLLDLQILFKTLMVILNQRNAY
jgi:Undecaprenyl-phosphate glucose phosphotransferase